MNKKLSNSKNQFLLDVIKSVVTPTYGCTEIGIVALVSSVAAEHLPHEVVSATLYVSTYIYRNDANVGVPNMGQVGIEAIATAGFLVKHSNKKLAVLEGITKPQVTKAIQMAKNGMVKVVVEKYVNPVFVKIIAKDRKGNVCDVAIEGKHDRIRYVHLNKKLVIDNQLVKNRVVKFKYNVAEISLHDICESVSHMSIKDLEFLIEGITMNDEILKAGIKKTHKQIIAMSDKNTDG
jgi:L-cysteine desulfidase